ncbi:MAG: hypothetical protein JKY43_04075 [Phycisphaerales bacterium]|nr:hypothetical protein [Phycisphaerales bacterium]
MTKKIPEDIPGKDIVDFACSLIGSAVGAIVFTSPVAIWPHSELAWSIGGEVGFDRTARLVITVLVPAFAFRHIGLKYYIRKIKTRRKQRGQCPLCGYPKPDTTAICPECGVSFEND